MLPQNFIEDTTLQRIWLNKNLGKCITLDPTTKHNCQIIRKPGFRKQVMVLSKNMYTNLLTIANTYEYYYPSWKLKCATEIKIHYDVNHKVISTNKTESLWYNNGNFRHSHRYLNDQSHD